MTTETTTHASVVRPPRLLAQTVVVIGGSAGIGLATARLARSEGGEVVLTGRDPQRLEESAGGLSVLAHLVSPRSRGLFNRAIVESGAFALKPWRCASAWTSPRLRSIISRLAARSPRSTRPASRTSSVAVSTRRRPP